MEFLQLQYFQAVARHEHMTNTAKELNVSQPSLSNSIQRLEKNLGVPLFERQGRNIKLNEFGKTYLQRVEQAFMELEEGQRELTDMAGLEHGVISIAVPPVCIAHFTKRISYPSSACTDYPTPAWLCVRNEK